MRRSFDEIAELRVDPATAQVYEEGWQSWSTAGVYRADATSPRPRSATHHTMGWRAKDLPARGFQGEGLLVVVLPGGDTRAWLATDSSLASIRAEALADRLVVSADAGVVELGARSLAHALTAVGERLRVPSVRAIPPGWCSWSYYFLDVTDADVRENVDAAERLGLPIEIVQLDDGWEAGIGDWLDVSPRFGSLADVAAFVRASGRVPGIWTAPFLVGTRSRLAAEHPDWLVPELDAGENWGQPLRVLDVSKPAAAAHLRHVYERLRELGFGFHKLDFLYAGALAGLDAYREGLRIIRAAAGDATLLGCGAPLLPSIGLVDAMRVGPDVIGEDASRWSRSIAHAREVTAARAWMNGRLWTSDPDHLLARPEVPDRDLWAAHVAEYDGVVLSGDRLSALDAHGVELTRRALVA